VSIGGVNELRLTVWMNVSTASIPTRESVFARRDFRLYFGSFFLAALAFGAQSVAVSWLIYDIARDPLALGYAGLAQFVPMVLLSLPAGDVADRYNRRTILTVGFIVQATCSAMFLALTITRYHVLWPFYVLLGMFGAARVFTNPAANSFLPLLVPEEQFPEAVAWVSSSRMTASIVGPALGGALYALGAGFVFAACLAVFVSGATAIAMIHTASEHAAPAPGVSSFARLTAGISYVRSRPLILGAISLDLFAVLLGGATALLPIYARDILHVGPAGLGLLRSAPGAGAAILGLVLVRLPLRRHAGLMMFSCVALFGISTIVFGLSRHFMLSLMALFVLGASDMISVYVRQTLIQLATPDSMRGRVSAVSFLFIGASNELGEFESGVTASWFGTVPSVVIGGLGTLAVVALWAWMFPSLRSIHDISAVTPESDQ
jgi:MFS family permease